MGITINSALTHNALNYNTPLSATAMNLCKQPPEGAKCVPMQFSPGGLPGNLIGSFLVDMGTGSPPPLSQVAALYIDASASTSDITILFADTGYEAKCPAGGSTLVPVLTGTGLPKFYVIFGNNAIFNIADVANIFALNIFVPEFSSNVAVNAFISGTTAGFAKGAFFVQPTANVVAVTLPGGGGIQGYGGYVATQTFLTSLEINGTIYSTDGNTYDGIISVYENQAPPVPAPSAPTVLMYEFAVIITPVKTHYKIANISGLNYITTKVATNFGNHQLVARLADPSGAILPNIAGTLYLNFMGGVLSIN